MSCLEKWQLDWLEKQLGSSKERAQILEKLNVCLPSRDTDQALAISKKMDDVVSKMMYKARPEDKHWEDINWLSGRAQELRVLLGEQ
jgi:hypothetical protein